MSVSDILERDNDRPAYVRFEQRAVPDKKATETAGHYVSKDEDWVLITPPYSKDCVEKKVETWFPQVEVNVKTGRIPEKHFVFWKESYERWKKGLEAPVNGTSVRDWNALSPAQCKNLISAGCLTIEDLAHANDDALRRIGMGAVDLKKKANTWLQAAKDHGPLTMEVATLQKENSQLKGSLEALQEQVTLLTRQLDARQSTPAPVQPVFSAGGISAEDILDKTPAEQYEEKFGKKPHHLMKEETILKKLKE